MSIAQRYLDAADELKSAEHAVDKALHGFLGDESDWEQFCDPYDSSLEVFVPGLAAERVEALGAFVLSLGFERCWIHPHGGGREQCTPIVNKLCASDRYFAAPRPNPAHEGYMKALKL